MGNPSLRHHGNALSRTVFKAMGVFGGMQVFSILCGIVRIKLIAVWLGTAGVGLFAIFNSAVTLVSGFSQLNLRTSAVRAIASGHDGRSLASVIYSVRKLALWLGLAGVAVMLLSAPVFSLRTFGSFEMTGSFMLLAVAVFVMSLTMAEQAALQGLERMRALAISNIRGVGIGLVVSLPLLYFFRMESVAWVIMAYSFTTWLGVRWSRAEVTLAGPAPKVREVWEIGRPILIMGFYLTLAAVLAELCSYIFIAYLNHSGGTSEVGLFQSGYTIVNRYMGMVFSAIGMEFFPRLTSASVSPCRTRIFVAHEILLLTMVMLGIVSIFIPLAPLGVRMLYTSDFLAIVPFVILSMPGVIIQGVSWCLAYVILARGDGRVYMAVEIFSTLTTITLNILFYRYWGLPGVGLSFTLYYLAYLFVLLPIYYRRYRLNIPVRTIWIVVTVFVAVCVTSATALLFNPLCSLFIAVPSLLISILSVRRLLG